MSYTPDPIPQYLQVLLVFPVMGSFTILIPSLWQCEHTIRRDHSGQCRPVHVSITAQPCVLQCRIILSVTSLISGMGYTAIRNPHCLHILIVLLVLYAFCPMMFEFTSTNPSLPHWGQTVNSIFAGVAFAGVDFIIGVAFFTTFFAVGDFAMNFPFLSLNGFVMFLTSML